MHPTQLITNPVGSNLMKNSRVVFLVLATLLSACSTLKDLTVQISVGDTKEKVVRILGTPDDRQFRDTKEAWQFGTVVAIGICEYTIIWFNNNIVTGLNSYRNGSVAGCRAGIKSIQWEEAPDAIVEIHHQ
jgi:hypothetical protein